MNIDMITTNDLTTIYIRFQYHAHDTIKDDAYIIAVIENDHMVMYKDEITIKIATSKQLVKAILD